PSSCGPRSSRSAISRRAAAASRKSKSTTGGGEVETGTTIFCSRMAPARGSAPSEKRSRQARASAGGGQRELLVQLRVQFQHVHEGLANQTGERGERLRPRQLGDPLLHLLDVRRCSGPLLRHPVELVHAQRVAERDVWVQPGPGR